MLSLDNFTTLAHYLNDELKGCYSFEEVLDNANTYYSEYLTVMRDKPSIVFAELLKLCECETIDELALLIANI